MSSTLAVILACAVGLGFATAPTLTKPSTPEPTGTRPGPSAADKADPAFEKRLTALDASIAKTTDFKANFEQRKYTPLLKQPMISKGVLTSKTGLVKWETIEPRPVTILIDPLAGNAAPPGSSPPVPSPKLTPMGPANAADQPAAAAPKSLGEMRVYYPRDQLCEIYPIGGALIDFAAAPLPRLAELRGRFTIESIAPSELGGATDNPALLGLLLRPKAGEIRQHIESIKLLIDETIPAATRVIVTDAEGERTEITLTSIQINSGLKDAEVQLTLPDGVRLSRPLGKPAPQAPTGLTAQPATSEPSPKTNSPAHPPR